MTWKDSLEIGIAEIDRQHKALCHMLDDFYAASDQGRGEEEVKRLLDFLATYAMSHFAEEEKLQLEIGYPRLEEHKAQHDGMRLKIAAMQKEVADWGAPVSTVKAVNEALTTWLIRHIMGFDMDIKKHIGQIKSIHTEHDGNLNENRG